MYNVYNFLKNRSCLPMLCYLYWAFINCQRTFWKRSLSFLISWFHKAERMPVLVTRSQTQAGLHEQMCAVHLEGLGGLQKGPYCGTGVLQPFFGPLASLWKEEKAETPSPFSVSGMNVAPDNGVQGRASLSPSGSMFQGRLLWKEMRDHSTGLLVPCTQNHI